MEFAQLRRKRFKLGLLIISAAMRTLQVTSLTGGAGRRQWHGDSGSSCQNGSWHMKKQHYTTVNIFVLLLSHIGFLPFAWH